MPIAPARESVTLNGVETGYISVGDGEAIVALHGIPTSSLLFALLLSHLRDYRVIAPDLLGQGRTGVPAECRLDYSAYANHLRSFMSFVPPERFHLLAHDLGGVLGLDWAVDNAERVKSLILLSTTATQSVRVGRLLYAANLIFGRSLLRWGMPYTLKRAGKLDSSLTTEWIEPWTRRRIARGADHFAASHLERIRSKMGRIQVPVLMVWGEEDNIFPLSHVFDLRHMLPQAKILTIKRCGHWSPIDAPGEVAAAVDNFLRAL